jgi:hypothetical protein
MKKPLFKILVIGSVIMNLLMIGALAYGMKRDNDTGLFREAPVFVYLPNPGGVKNSLPLTP